MIRSFLLVELLFHCRNELSLFLYLKLFHVTRRHEGLISLACLRAILCIRLGFHSLPRCSLLDLPPFVLALKLGNIAALGTFAQGLVFSFLGVAEVLLACFFCLLLVVVIIVVKCEGVVLGSLDE